MRFVVLLVSMAVTSVGCAPNPLDAVADTYVELAVALDAHDPGYVDATLRAVSAEPQPLDAIEAKARATRDAMTGASRRGAFLARQLESLAARASLLRRPGSMSFDDEARALLGAEPPARLPAEDAEPVLAVVDRLVPGSGSLLDRVAELEARVVVSPQALENVAAAALEACRERAVVHVPLPENESVSLELVRGQPWASYHDYRGGFRSIVRVNADARWTVSRLLDAMCHEGYPGHHMMTVLIDERFVSSERRAEHSVQVLTSPRGFELERAAAASAGLVFSEDDRRDVERELFSLAGLDPTLATEQAAVDRAVKNLEPFAIEGARRYLDGELDRVQAVLWLEKYALVSDPWGFLFFADRYRSYVLAYPDRDSMPGWEAYEKLVEAWDE